MAAAPRRPKAATTMRRGQSRSRRTCRATASRTARSAPRTRSVATGSVGPGGSASGRGGTARQVEVQRFQRGPGEPGRAAERGEVPLGDEPAFAQEPHPVTDRLREAEGVRGDEDGPAPPLSEVAHEFSDGEGALRVE